MGPSDSNPRRVGVVGQVIGASARNPLLVMLVVAGLAAWGWLSLRRAPLDAIPDLSDAQVIIFTEWMGRSPGSRRGSDHVPDLDVAARRSGVQYVRGQSMFGMSFV